MTKPLLIVTSLFLSVLPGCGDRDSPEGPAAMTQPKPPGTYKDGDDAAQAFIEGLKHASSDAEKWRLTLRYYEWDESEAQRYIPSWFKMFGSATAFAKYYPNVTKHIQLDKSCFGYMAAYIGSDEMLPHRGPQALTAGELSAIWLKHLTGREFQDREEFNNWFDANQEYLKWNQETGKFEIHRPQTFPAVEIPKRSEPHMQCKNHRGAIGEAGVEAQLGSAAIYAAPIWCIWGRRAVIL